jgi:hypothetical protein
VTPPVRFMLGEVATLLGLVLDTIKDELADSARWCELKKLRRTFARLLAADYERIASNERKPPADN